MSKQQENDNNVTSEVIRAFMADAPDAVLIESEDPTCVWRNGSDPNWSVAYVVSTLRVMPEATRVIWGGVPTILHVNVNRYPSPALLDAVVGNGWLLERLGVTVGTALAVVPSIELFLLPAEAVLYGRWLAYWRFEPPGIDVRLLTPPPTGIIDGDVDGVVVVDGIVWTDAAAGELASWYERCI